MAKQQWTADNIPSMGGKLILITGANTGLGKQASKILSGKGAQVIMAVRTVEKGEAAKQEILSQLPSAQLEVMELNLGSLASIKTFAEAFLKRFDRLDVLVNNAGIMMCPYSKTDDGFEIQMGTNHLGHFALTGLLFPLLEKTSGSRVVSTSSVGHHMGNIDFTDINWEKRKYVTTTAYGDSKLANLYFTYELARRLRDSGEQPMAVVAHPGVTATDLDRHSAFFRFFNKFMAQKVENGVLPTLRAATDPDAQPGQYFGPDGFRELRGYPVLVDSNELSHDRKNAELLWKLSEEMTGISF